MKGITRVLAVLAVAGLLALLAVACEEEEETATPAATATTPAATATTPAATATTPAATATTPVATATTPAATETPTETPTEAVAEVEDEWGVIEIDADEPIKIGISTSLSGGTAQLGEDIRDGAVLAQLQRPEVAGHEVELVAEDDGCAGQQSVAAAKKFIADDAIAAVIGPMCSGGAVPASDEYEKARLTMVSASATNPAVTGRGLEVVFRTAWNDAIQGAGQANYALDKLGATTAVVIHDKSIYGQGLTEIFAEGFTAGGGEILATEAITVGDKDFSAVITKIQPLNPELIVFGGFTPEGTLLIQQLRAAGIETPFMGADGVFVKSDFIDAAAGAAEGAYASNGQPVTGPTYEQFKADFESEFGRPLGVFSAQAGDAYNVIADAIEEVAVEQDGKLLIGRKALNDALRGTSYEGLTGTIEFEEDGDRVSGTDVAMYQVQNNEFVLLEVITAE